MKCLFLKSHNPLSSALQQIIERIWPSYVINSAEFTALSSANLYLQGSAVRRQVCVSANLIVRLRFGYGLLWTWVFTSSSSGKITSSVWLFTYDCSPWSETYSAIRIVRQVQTLVVKADVHKSGSKIYKSREIFIRNKDIFICSDIYLLVLFYL